MAAYFQGNQHSQNGIMCVCVCVCVWAGEPFPATGAPLLNPHFGLEALQNHHFIY